MNLLQKHGLKMTYTCTEHHVNRAAPVTLESSTTLVGAATVEQMFGGCEIPMTMSYFVLVGVPCNETICQRPCRLIQTCVKRPDIDSDLPPSVKAIVIIPVKGLSYKKFNFRRSPNKLSKLSAKSSSWAFLLTHPVACKTCVTNVLRPAKRRWDVFFLTAFDLRAA